MPLKRVEEGGVLRVCEGLLAAEDYEITVLSIISKVKRYVHLLNPFSQKLKAIHEKWSATAVLCNCYCSDFLYGVDILHSCFEHISLRIMSEKNSKL